MKSNIFKSMVVAVVAIIAGYNVYLAQAESYNEMSDLLLANVEALAQNEGREAVITCSQYCNDGIGRCWFKNGNDYCVFSGSQFDNCTGFGCLKSDGTIY